MVTIDLNETKYERVFIPELKTGDRDADLNWFRCWSENSKFKGVGGPSKLTQILEYFLDQMKQRDGGIVKLEALNK